MVCPADQNQLSLGKKVEEIKIEFRFTTFKPLECYNEITSNFLPATIDQLTDELWENFVNVPFDEENSKWEQSDNENDVDSERNIFDAIIIDDE